MAFISFGHFFHKKAAAETALVWLQHHYARKKPLYDLLFNAAFNKFGDFTEGPASRHFKSFVLDHAALATTWLASTYKPDTQLHQHLTEAVTSRFGELASLKTSDKFKAFVTECLDSPAFLKYKQNYNAEVQALEAAQKARELSPEARQKARNGFMSLFQSSASDYCDPRTLSVDSDSSRPEAHSLWSLGG
jgi:hypothetical protein